MNTPVDDTPAALLVHSVFFTLTDGSDAAVERLLADCREYLTGHPGVESFAAGRPVEDLDRPVNARDFHVGLHLVFRSRQAHDDYQVSQRHLEFIARNKETWSQVRVFDTGEGAGSE